MKYNIYSNKEQLIDVTELSTNQIHHELIEIMVALGHLKDTTDIHVDHDRLDVIWISNSTGLLYTLIGQPS